VFHPPVRLMPAESGALEEHVSLDRATVSVIIPTLNEAGNLPYILNTIPSWVDEIILVDGRSDDDTRRIAEILRPDVRIIHEFKKGKGAAMKAGLYAARGDILIALDADGSMDGGAIGKFRDAILAGADYVKGSRFATGGGSSDITKFRRLGDRGICYLIWLFFGSLYSDATYGYIAIRATSLDALNLDSDGFEIETLIGIRALRARLNTTEVPCYEASRINGVSHLSVLHDGWRIFRTIVGERMRRGHRVVAG
jgi:glycosyltransferase involved in cell wall biosynthesis